MVQKNVLYLLFLGFLLISVRLLLKSKYFLLHPSMQYSNCTQNQRPSVVLAKLYILDIISNGKLGSNKIQQDGNEEKWIYISFGEMHN